MATSAFGDGRTRPISVTRAPATTRASWLFLTSGSSTANTRSLPVPSQRVRALGASLIWTFSREAWRPMELSASTSASPVRGPSGAGLARARASPAAGGDDPTRHKATSVSAATIRPGIPRRTALRRRGVVASFAVGGATREFYPVLCVGHELVADTAHRQEELR